MVRCHCSPNTIPQARISSTLSTASGMRWSITNPTSLRLDHTLSFFSHHKTVSVVIQQSLTFGQRLMIVFGVWSIYTELRSLIKTYSQIKIRKPDTCSHAPQGFLTSCEHSRPLTNTVDWVCIHLELALSLKNIADLSLVCTCVCVYEKPSYMKVFGARAHIVILCIHMRMLVSPPLELWLCPCSRAKTC